MVGRQRAIRIVLAGTLLVALAACTERFRNHGYVPSEEELAGIVVGVDTRDSVSETVGPPSTASLVDSSGYYYVRSRVRHFAYREPQEIDRQVVAITFDDGGVVRNIERFGMERGQMVPLSRRVTRVESSDNNFLKRLLRAVGQFSASDVFN